MTLTPNAVERCKAVPKHARLELHFAGFVDGDIVSGLCGPVSLATLWSAFDTLLADNARMREAIRHFHNDPDTSPTPCGCEWCKETR